jgi:hypothetical protein
MSETAPSDRQIGFNDAVNGIVKAIQIGQTSNSAPPGYSFVMMNHDDMSLLSDMMRAFREQQNKDTKPQGSCYGCCPSGVPCGKTGCPGGEDAVQQG